MNAFETELGVMSEIAEAVNNMGWLLPTDIQSEAIPLILGGGDVLIAAETGSGKTGAFCLPVIQIVYETLKDIQEHKGMGGAKMGETKSLDHLGFKMSVFDRTPSMAIDPEGLLCQTRDENQWHGCRCTKGVVNKGKYYFEAKVTDEGLCRVGWSTQDAVLDLGTDRLGYGFGGTGKKSYGIQFDNYGESYGKDDIIGCCLDLDNLKIKWSKNGKVFDNAYDIQSGLKNYGFFPAVCMKNAEIKFNFGETEFSYPPKDGYIGISEAPKNFTISSPRSSSAINRGATKRENNAPLALIIEPSKELAEQTLKQIEIFKRNLENPKIKDLLIVGGLPVKEQISALNAGCDIVVATPGRLDDLISTESLSLNQVRFFILDEVDGLLTQGHRDLINRIYRKIPGVSAEGKRLQMIVCSATLHNFEVKKLAETIMHFPTWIDLKGQDSVPETVHHCVCLIDPKEDVSWRGLKRHVQTDGVHATDRLNYQSESREMLSEAIKLLKAEYCVRAIEKYKMDKALIFCRTKLDCDNLENYFTSLGGGPRSRGGPTHQFSCVCLHADRNPNERTENLEKFKQDKVRLLICTDVAARGLDIKGLPYVINFTLPDEKQNYVHRIGRVGRADRMGLAISFASKVQEKVWYHSCQSRGKNCTNRLLKDEGGCCIWYNEMYYLDEIEEHLGCTIPQIPSSLEVPINEFDGKVVYGEKRKVKANAFKGHVDQLAPTVNELLNLEKKTQDNFLYMKFGKNLEKIL